MLKESWDSCIGTSTKLISHSALIHYTCIISQSRSLLFQPGNTGGGKRPFMMQAATAPLSDESALLNGLHSEERTHHSCKELWLVASHVCAYQRSTTNPTFQHHAVVEAKIPTSQSGPPCTSFLPKHVFQCKTCLGTNMSYNVRHVWVRKQDVTWYSSNQAVEPKACKHMSALNTSHANNLNTENRFFPMQAAWFCLL